MSNTNHDSIGLNEIWCAKYTQHLSRHEWKVKQNNE